MRKQGNQGQALLMALNGGAEQGRIGSGSDKRRLKDDAGVRMSGMVKADSGHRGGLYMQADATLAGTLTTLVTVVI